MKNKKVSICIPVFCSEPYLEECLKSVKNQTFTDYEVIVVNDCSTGKDSEGRNCKAVIKNIIKKYKLPVNYIEHQENRGLLEARRSAIYAAKGDYIILLDSDDKLPANSLELLYNKAIETDADIVHGKADLFYAFNNPEQVFHTEEEQKKAKDDRLKKIQNVFLGTLEKEEIMDSYLVENNHCGFLWGKLFKRELYLDAFNEIPPMFCTLAEDFIQYFWLTYYAKKYVGIADIVYSYCLNTGVTSGRVINTTEKWEQVCSVASVFAAVYTKLQEENIELSAERKQSLDKRCCNYVINNLQQLDDAVVPELHEQCYNILCDYWGKNFVSKVEAEYKKSKI